jgi:tRNA1Val (adenine37-N6)-methyltransferase
MTDYSQPDFYRFNQDSLELVKRVKHNVDKCESILDLGAGCGVIGLELARFYLPHTLALVELQQDYEPLLQHNLSFLMPGTECSVHIKSFAQWRPTKKYEIIVCNPPYFLPGRGQKSKDPRRDLARSFHQDNWKELLCCIERSLTFEGKAFLVLKNEGLLLTEVRNAIQQTGLSGDISFFMGLAFLDIT